jgi:hypothetical protein
MTAHLHQVPRLRMRGAIPPLSQYVFMAWCLVKHRDNFTFPLTFTLVSMEQPGAVRTQVTCRLHLLLGIFDHIFLT